MRKLRYEVVPESEYTDFSERYKEFGLSTGTMVGIGATTVGSIAAYGITTKSTPPIEHTTIEPLIEPTNVLSSPEVAPVFMSAQGTPEMIPTGIIADTSLNMLANVLDPVIQILVAISFPIASVIMVGACFFFMIGNSERAWSTLMNAGLGYVLIQMSPLFLEILRQIGKAI